MSKDTGGTEMNQEKESFEQMVLKALSETPLYTHPTTHYTAFASLIRNEVAGPLLAQIDELNSQCRFWEGTSAYHAKRYDELAAGMAGSNVRRLEAENTQMKTDIENLHNRNIVARRGLNFTSELYDQALKDLQDSSDENARLKDEVVACQAELAAAKQDFADVHADYQSCSAKLHQCAQELASEHENIDNLREEVKDLKQELAAIKKQESVAWLCTDPLNPQGWVTRIGPEGTVPELVDHDVVWNPLYLHPAPIPADMVMVPEYTTGHCENHKHPKGCQLHNIQCGWPECDRRLITASQEKKS